MDRSKARRKRKITDPRHKIYRTIGIILISGGLLILAYYGIQKAIIRHNQKQIHQDYVGFYEDYAGLPSDPLRNITITEQLPMWLTIPKIDVSLGVLYGDFHNTNENEQRSLLDRAPVHFTYFSTKADKSNYYEGDLPSTNPSNVAIAGHRGARWGFFTHVDQLEPGDEIFLDIGGYRFIYHVEFLTTLDHKDWSLITDPVDYPALTLQTCTFHDTTLRFFVRAALDEVIINEDAEDL